MELKIVKEEENKVLERKEINFKIDGAKATPSRKEIKKRLAALKNSKEELVSIDSIKQAYGEHKAQGKAFIYKNLERLNKIEPTYLKHRGQKKKHTKEKEEKSKEKKKKEKPKKTGEKEKEKKGKENKDKKKDKEEKKSE